MTPAAKRLKLLVHLAHEIAFEKVRLAERESRVIQELADARREVLEEEAREQANPVVLV